MSSTPLSSPLEYSLNSDGTVWHVFDGVQGIAVANGVSTGRTASLEAIVRALATHDEGAAYVLGNSAGWFMWREDLEAWTPLPLPASAYHAQVELVVGSLPRTKGKPVHIVEL